MQILCTRAGVPAQGRPLRTQPIHGTYFVLGYKGTSLRYFVEVPHPITPLHQAININHSTPNPWAAPMLSWSPRLLSGAAPSLEDAGRKSDLPSVPQRS